MGIAPCRLEWWSITCFQELQGSMVVSVELRLCPSCPEASGERSEPDLWGKETHVINLKTPKMYKLLQLGRSRRHHRTSWCYFQRGATWNSSNKYLENYPAYDCKNSRTTWNFLIYSHKAFQGALSRNVKVFLTSWSILDRTLHLNECHVILWKTGMF